MAVVFASYMVEPGDVVCETYPGAAKDVMEQINAEGGLVCEQHPHLPFEHDDCPGPGMTRLQAIKDGLL